MGSHVEESGCKVGLVEGSGATGGLQVTEGLAGGHYGCAIYHLTNGLQTDTPAHVVCYPKDSE